MLRVAVGECPGFPDRIALRDMAVGDHALPLNHVHLDVASPYRASHAIHMRKRAETAYGAEDEVPEVMLRRVLPLRGIDARGRIVAADLAEGAGVDPLIRRLLLIPEVVYIQAHNAKQGCYAGRIDRT